MKYICKHNKKTKLIRTVWILIKVDNTILKCEANGCKISGILIKDAHCTSNLTKTTYFTRRYNDQ